MAVQTATRAPGGVFGAESTTSNSATDAPHPHHQRSHQRRADHPQRTRTSTSRRSDASDTIHVKTRVVARPNTINGDGGAETEGEGDMEGRPPPKKRKLSIRTSNQQQNHHNTHRQSTLDAWAFHQAKPPAKIVRDEPHGQLHQTINGVRTALDADEDELLRPSPKPERMPRRATRSPVPAQPTQQQQKQEDKRTLRSQDEGPRLKSELAVYFPNYEDVIFDALQQEEFLTIDTALYITDDTKKEEVSPAKSTKASVNGRRTSVNDAPSTPHQRSSSNQFNGSPMLNLDVFKNNLPERPDDPLSEEHFLKSHKRAERKEKQLRNIERERAMHEKVQLDRLLDGLQGHDWLRVLGITGVTETEAKKYEPKRAYFIAEVQALVDKFKQWKEQEKKIRLEKEAAQAARDAEDGETTEGSVEPPSSDLNASAARQLQQETVNAVKKGHSKGKDRAHGYTATSHAATPSTPGPPKLMLQALPPSPEIPITSFYEKRHLRDAALSKTRHGRNVLAFGQPLPEMEEVEFMLPSDYVTEDALRSNARERRRRKRESAANAAGSK